MKPCQHPCSKNPFQGGTPLQDGCGVTPGLGAVASLHGLLGPEGPSPCATLCPCAPKNGSCRLGWGTHREPRAAAAEELCRLLLSARDRKTLESSTVCIPNRPRSAAAARCPSQRCGKAGPGTPGCTALLLQWVLLPSPLPWPPLSPWVGALQHPRGTATHTDGHTCTHTPVSIPGRERALTMSSGDRGATQALLSREGPLVPAPFPQTFCSFILL